MERQLQTVNEIIKQGEGLFYEGKVEEAEEYFLSLLLQYPTETNIRNNLGTIKFAQGDIVTAKEYYLSALAFDENNDDALSNLKELYRRYGSWEEYPQRLIDAETATSFFEEAFKLDPKDPGIQNDIGIMQLNAGQVHHAEHSFRAALNLDPSYQEAYYYLGKILMSKERYAEAIDNFIAAIILSPESEIAIKATREYQNDETIKRIGEKYKNILIIMEEGIGNMIMLTPTLKAIKELHPSSSITLLGRMPSIKVIENWDSVDMILIQPDNKSYDIAMLTIWSVNFISTYKSWIDDHCKQVFLSSLQKDQHESFSHLHIARCLGYTKDRPEPFCSRVDKDYGIPKDKPIAALSDTTLNNGAWERKRWPYYKELSQELISRGYKVLLIGGKDENSQYKPEDWPSDVVNLMGKYDLPETAGILKQCDMFIGNDSGPAHIAAAMGILTYVIFGPTLISKNKPIGSQVKVIKANLPCEPCQYTVNWTQCNDWKCMKVLKPEIILNNIQGEIQKANYYLTKNREKVLIVGVLDIYSSTNISIRNHFRDLGWITEDFNYRTVARQHGYPKMNKILRKKVKSGNYDLIFFCKGNGISSDTIHYCNTYSKTWLWFMDPIETAKSCQTINLVKVSNYASATYSDVARFFKSVNPSSYHIFDGADLDIYNQHKSDKEFDVIFIGNHSVERAQTIEGLRQKAKVDVFGSGWDETHDHNHPPVYGENFSKICSKAKIVLNLPSFKGQSGFSVRVFNVMSCGAFVLSEYLPDLSFIFTKGKHIEYFNSMDDASQILEFYLKNGTEREAIANNAKKLVQKKYTWSNSVEHILTKIDNEKPNLVNNVRKILFLFWHGLGDNILATPALYEYKREFPDIKIGWATKKEIKAQRLLEYNDCIDRIHPILSNPWNHPEGYNKGIEKAIEEAINLSKQYNYDEIRLIPTQHDGNFNPHKIHRIANEMGIAFDKSTSLKTFITIPFDIEKSAKNFINGLSKPVIFFHGETGFSQKNPPKDLLKKILGSIQSYCHKSTIIEMGTDYISNSIKLDYGDLLYSAALIKHSDYVIAADSVCMHLAGSFEKPMTAIFTIFPSHQVIPLSYDVNIIDFTIQQEVDIQSIVNHFLESLLKDNSYVRNNRLSRKRRRLREIRDGRYFLCDFVS